MYALLLGLVGLGKTDKCDVGFVLPYYFILKSCSFPTPILFFVVHKFLNRLAILSSIHPELPSHITCSQNPSQNDATRRRFYSCEANSGGDFTL